VIPDGPEIVDALRDAVNHNINVVVTTGGTGHTPNDVTPEMTLQVIERHSPGIAEAIRAYGVANGIPTAILSRGVAGIAAKTFIVNLPGSSGGVRDGMKVLSDVLVHLVDQMNGGDHTRKD
jgi:molybdenum cofactor synthesis domain-containing protein